MGNGEEYLADVILGVDGLHSTCRTLLQTHINAPFPSGDIAYWFTVKVDNVMQQQDLRDLLEGFPVVCWTGPNAHVLCYQVKQGGICNVVLLSPDNIQEAAVVSKADIQETRDCFSDWDPKLKEFIELADEALKWRLEVTKPLNKWTSSNDRVLSIVDACHSTLP